MADRPNRVKQQLGNDRLIGILGEGGFAEVYLGEHIHLGTKAAVKVLHAQLTHENVDAFRTEARTIAHLVHPHIVRVLEFGVEGRTPFLVMDYAPNGTLRNLHPKGALLAVATIVSYIKQVADALQYAHDEKLIHRDIKPENMLVGRRHEVFLSDFGIALVAQSSRYQSIQEVIGTVVYMAPEQIQGKPRPASDQYSLGIAVYEWLCGDRPFHGSFTELCTQHMFAPPPPLREKLPTLSPDLEQVVMTALAKDPKQRFGSVQAFATALEQVSQSGQSQPSLSSGVTLASKPVSPSVLATPPNRSSEPIMSSANRSSALEQANQSEQHQPPVSLPIATPASQSLPATVLATPPNHIRELTTQAPPPSYSSYAPEVSGTQLPMPQPTSRPSRRTVIAGLVGLTLVGSGITWFATSRSSTSKPILSMTPTSPTPTPLPIGTTLYTYKGHSSRVELVAWSPDGKRIASAGDTTVQVWDAIDGGHTYAYKGHQHEVSAVAWSPDGKRIASAEETVQVWDAVDGGNAYAYKGHQYGVSAVAWSPDGKRIASGSSDHTVQVWDAVDGGNVYTYKGHSDTVYSVAWSPDGKRIASGSADKTVQVWDAVDGRNVYAYKGHQHEVSAVAWSPNGKHIASGDVAQTAQVWDAVDGRNIYTYHQGPSSVYANIWYKVPWSPDSNRIASGSHDGTVQVWDATDGSNVFTYKGHSSFVYSVAWSPDGKRIASGSWDQTVQVWEAL